MNPAPRKPARNTSMECAKLVASFFVIFLHVPFPGEFGGLMVCLSRFAVPMFFAISGFFSYRTKPDRLLKRMGRILLLEFLGISLQLLWKSFQSVYYGATVQEYLLSVLPDGKALIQWILLNIDPFSGPLWYLSAMAVCYGLLWGYVRFFGGKEDTYRPVYLLGVCLLAAHFALSEFLPLWGIRVDFRLYRNAWLFGLPMFTMGIFLREYQQAILSRFRLTGPKLAVLLLFGALLGILEWKIIGACEMHVGTVILVAALILLTAAYPTIPGSQKLYASFGSLSTGIYLLHLIVYEIYTTFFQWRLVPVLGTAEEWLRPLMVLAVSLAAAILSAGILSLLCKPFTYTSD